MITKSTIDAVYEKMDIVEVVSDFLALKKRGGTYEGCCPLHGEKTPSFKVSQSKGIFKCFGCGKGGDAVRFVMEHEKTNYPEAIKYLAIKYKIAFELEELDEAAKEKESVRDTLFLINQLSMEQFQLNLKVNPDQLTYIKERGWSEKTIETFKVGYALDFETNLTNHLISCDYSAEQLVSVNVSRLNDRNVAVDKFRHRIIFPIHNVAGRIVGFGGRILTADRNKPKYVNTAETDIYHKSNILYGLYFAKRAIVDLDNCYLTEGYADVLSVFQSGVENVVASSGTSLTEDQIRLIGRFTKNITFLFDGDDAGIKATLRGMEMILQEGFNVRIVQFPDKHDPDSFIQAFGDAKFKEHLEANKVDVIDFLYRDWAEMDARQKDETATLVINLIAKIPREQTYLINEHIEKLGKNYGGEIGKIRWRVKQLQQGIQVEEPITEIISESIECIQEIEFVKTLIVYGKEDYSPHHKCYYYMLEKAGLPDNFKVPIAKLIYEAYISELNSARIPDLDFFIRHEVPEINDFAVDIEFDNIEVSHHWENNSGALPQPNPISIIKNITNIFMKTKLKERGTELLKKIAITDDNDELVELYQRYKNVKLQLSMECSEMGITLV